MSRYVTVRVLVIGANKPATSQKVRIHPRTSCYLELVLSMAAHAARLARIFTPEYACRINAQIVHPAPSQLVKPNELQSALARPLNVAVYEPHRHATYLAATLSYGVIKGMPFPA